MISAATYRLVEGLFACEDRGQPALKGVAIPFTLYHVVKEEEAQSRFQVVAQRAHPARGSRPRVWLLRERWERVKDGAGQAILLSGEPGIGKSRLVQALKEGVKLKELLHRVSLFALSPEQCLYPIIEHLQRVLGFRPDDESEEKLRKLELGVRHQTRGLSPLSGQLPGQHYSLTCRPPFLAPA